SGTIGLMIPCTWSPIHPIEANGIQEMLAFPAWADYTSSKYSSPNQGRFVRAGKASADVGGSPSEPGCRRSWSSAKSQQQRQQSPVHALETTSLWDGGEVAAPVSGGRNMAADHLTSRVVTRVVLAFAFGFSCLTAGCGQGGGEPAPLDPKVQKKNQ